MITASVPCPRFVGRRREHDVLVELRRDLSKGHGGIVLVGHLAARFAVSTSAQSVIERAIVG